MAETLTRFDAADYLRTPADIAAYLAASAEENDPEARATALATVARARHALTRKGASRQQHPRVSAVAGLARALNSEVGYRPLATLLIKPVTTARDAARTLRLLRPLAQRRRAARTETQAA